MKVQIWVRDMVVAEKKENLGMETGEKEYSLTTFTFDRKKLTGFWVDNPEDIDGETGVRDIAFYVDGYYFRTPYHEEKEKMFNKIIEDNEQA